MKDLGLICEIIKINDQIDKNILDVKKIIEKNIEELKIEAEKGK